LVWIVEDSAVTADRPRVGGCASALDARWFRPRHTGSQRICHRGDRCRWTSVPGVAEPPGRCRDACAGYWCSRAWRSPMRSRLPARFHRTP